MKDFLCNTPELFIREIKHVLIYNSNILSFNENYRGLFPDTDKFLFKISVNEMKNYKRKLSLKRINHNKFFSINIVIPFLNLSFENRKKLYDLDKEKSYLIVLVSNYEMMLLGNKREPLSVNVIDRIIDNGKGSDHFQINIKGETIIAPMIRRVTEPFRVLFFARPFV